MRHCRMKTWVLKMSQTFAMLEILLLVKYMFNFKIMQVFLYLFTCMLEYLRKSPWILLVPMICFLLNRAYPAVFTSNFFMEIFLRFWKII